MADWHAYEHQITERLRQRARGRVKITPNTSLPGRLSGVSRQIDILVEGSFAGVADATMIVDCKCWSSKVDVKDVETFIGMLDDVGTHLGMLVTTNGFTPAAQQRAAHVLQEVVPLVNIAVFDEASSYWLMRAGSSGEYVGEYVDHEPYGRFWWVVSFETGGDQGDGGYEEPEQDVLWSSSEGGWESNEGAKLLATLLARHRLGRTPTADEVTNLSGWIRRHAQDGQGFYASTSEIDEGIWEPELPDEDADS